MEQSWQSFLFLTNPHLFNIPSCQLAAEELRKKATSRAWFSNKYAHHIPFHAHPIKIHQCHSVNINMLLPEKGVHKASLSKSFLSLVNSVRTALHV